MKKIIDDKIQLQKTNLNSNITNNTQDNNGNTQQIDIDQNNSNDSIEYDYNNKNLNKSNKEKYPNQNLLDENLNTTGLNKIKQGFKINFLKMKDDSNGSILWETSDFDLFDSEKIEDLPKEILECQEIVREINFSSKEKIFDLELIQNFYLMGELIETARFYFGFVIPGSTNNWEQVVEAKAPEEMLSYEQLSGNLVVEILFLSKGELIVRNRIIINYV